VGASENPESISGRPLKLLKRYGFSGRIYPVNPRYASLGEWPCYPDLAALPETPDVVLVAVRAALVPEVLRGCVRRGVPAAILFSSGFAEAGEPEAQRRIVEIARSGGIRLLGPNCQGLVNLAEGIPLSFSASLDSDRRPRGPVAYVSQSGAFGFASFAMAAEAGTGFRYVVTTGNQADLDAVEIGRALLEDPEVRLLALYLEGLDEGGRFVDLLREAAERDLPVAILKAGRSETAREAARSHTAALAGDDAVWRAVFRQYGVIPLEDADDLADLGKWVTAGKRPRGNRAAILTTSGGMGIILSDACAEAGIAVPELSPPTREAVERCIPPFGSSRNPVDMTAQTINDPEGFSGCLRAVLDSPETDLVLTAISMITGTSGRRMAEDLIAAAGRTDRPLACCWLIDEEHGGENLARLREGGVPLFRSLRRAVRSLGGLLGRRADPREPEPALPPSRLAGYPREMAEWSAKRFLAEQGLPIPREVLASDVSEALALFRSLAGPVALKVQSPDLPHKTEAGAVALNLSDEGAIREAWTRILASARAHAPGARIEGVLAQEMIPEGIECLVGVRRDPVFGPLVAVGLGGIYVEVLRDVVLRRAPVGPGAAMRMIRELAGAPLLLGARGKPPRDVAALAALVSRLSCLAVAEPDLEELDCNPVFVRTAGEGVLIADALVRRKGEGA